MAGRLKLYSVVSNCCKAKLRLWLQMWQAKKKRAPTIRPLQKNQLKLLFYFANLLSELLV